MNRFSVTIIVIFIIVSIVSFGIVNKLNTRQSRKLKKFYELSRSDYVDILQGSASQKVQIKYNHSRTKSNGDGHIFNDLTMCLRQGRTKRIRGGVNAIIGDVQYIALLEYLSHNGGYSFDCSGSLINHRYVLTAAHCIRNKNLVNIRLGEMNLLTNPDCFDGTCQPTPLNVGIDETIVHENYSQSSKNNDIALIRLSMDVPHIDVAIKPICIPYKNMSTPLQNYVLVAGWGSNGIVKQTSNLQVIYIQPYKWSRCRKKYAPIKIFSSQLCAGGVSNQDACVRDSGGPLVMASGRNLYLEGIVSFGMGCGKPGWPGVYTRVGHFYDWIVDHLKP